MTKSKKVFLFVFALVIVGLSVALIVGLSKVRGRYRLLDQVEKIPFEHLVQGINFDKQGHMWVSDSLKLYEYKNGLLVNEYWKQKPEGYSTGPDTIAFDNSGQIWVATKQQEVAVLNKGKWTTIYTVPGTSRDGEILSFSLDPQGNAWVGIYDKGIRVIGKTGKVLNTYDVSNSSLEDNDVVDIKFDDKGIAWISTFRWKTGVNTFDGNEWKTYDIGGGKIAFDRNNRVWVGTDLGISVFDGANWTNYNPGTGSVIDIALDQSGRVWTLSEDGPCELCMFDGKDWKYYYPKNRNDTFDFVSSYLGDRLATDKEGNVWFASFSLGGMYQISSNFPMFTLSERSKLSFYDTGIYFVLIFILVNLWFVFAMQSWRNIGSGIIVGMLVSVLGILFFHVDAWSVNNPGIFVSVGGIIGGFVGRLREKSGKTGAERAGVIKGLIIVLAIWSLLTFCYAITPKA